MHDYIFHTHLTSFHSISLTSLHLTSTSLQFAALHFRSLHFTSLHFSSLFDLLFESLGAAPFESRLEWPISLFSGSPIVSCVHSGSNDQYCFRARWQERSHPRVVLQSTLPRASHGCWSHTDVLHRMRAKAPSTVFSQRFGCGRTVCLLQNNAQRSDLPTTNSATRAVPPSME